MFAGASCVFSPSLASEEVDEMFTGLDVDCDGQINLDHGVRLVVEGDGEKSADEVLTEKGFEMYDTESLMVGMISAIDSHVLFKRLGVERTVEECDAIVRALDGDGIGFVSLINFKTY